MHPNQAAVVPLEVWYSACFGYVDVKERWHSLALVSRAWRVAALASVKALGHLDLTWCRGEKQLEHAVRMLLMPLKPDDEKILMASCTRIELSSIRLYGPRVTKPTLSRLLGGVGPLQFDRVFLESKQVDAPELHLLAQCCRLRTLHLNCIKLADDDLVQIARACPDLEELNVAGCSRIGDASLVAMALHCPKLQVLDVSMCIRVTDHGLHAMALHPPTLTSITINKCLKVSDVSVAHLLHKQHNLTHLSVANCPRLHHALLVAPPGGARSGLAHASLMGCAMIDDAPPPNQTLGSFSQFLHHHSKSLTSLDLTGLVKLPSASIQRLAACDQLVALNLSMCRTVSDADVAVIAAGCPRLEELSLQGCVHITDKALFALASHCHGLERLSLVFCYNITDRGFCTLVKHCLKLTHINVKACNALNEVSFATLAGRRSPVQLAKLVIGACASLATTALYASIIKQTYPHCIVMWT